MPSTEEDTITGTKRRGSHTWGERATGTSNLAAATPVIEKKGSAPEGTRGQVRALWIPVHVHSVLRPDTDGAAERRGLYAPAVDARRELAIDRCRDVAAD